MTLKNKNPWKYLSVGLLGVIAVGLFAPVQAAPGNAQSGWQAVADGLQSQIDAIVGGDFQGQIDALEARVANLENLHFYVDTTFYCNLEGEDPDRWDCYNICDGSESDVALEVLEYDSDGSGQDPNGEENGVLREASRTEASVFTILCAST
jgi:hypothetical protein